MKRFSKKLLSYNPNVKMSPNFDDIIPCYTMGKHGKTSYNAAKSKLSNKRKIGNSGGNSGEKVLKGDRSKLID